MSDYEDILNQSFDDLPEVKTLPVGSYRLKGSNASFKEGDGDVSDRFMFVYEVKEPLDDVDEDELAALGGDYDLSENKIFHTVWVDSRAEVRTKVGNHLAKHGVDTKSGSSIGEMLKAFKSTEVVAYLESRTYTDNAGEVQTTNDARNFAPVED